MLKTRVLASLAEVPRESWDELVGPEDPFLEHRFLSLLESSGSVGGRTTGWLPCHVIVEAAGKLVGAMPLYLKTHSYGEFIFDFGWAQAAMRAGLHYYPKLVSAVPFTPVTGSRLLTHPAAPRAEVVAALVQTALGLTRELGASSLHVLFCTAREQRELAAFGLHPRASYQFHWEQELPSFDAFLELLRSPSRKQVRKERERAQASGLALSMSPVRELGETERKALWAFYTQTIDDKGSTAYLSESFFMGLAELDTAYAALAHDAGEPVAGALFFHKGRSLYGRYWGARREVPMLHFELCYYLPMAWGIARGMRRFEAGAQGEHKIKRGFLPRPCFSAHRMLQPGLDQAVAAFLRDEQQYVEQEMKALGESTPYRRE